MNKAFFGKFGMYIIAAILVAASAVCLFAVFETAFMAEESLESVPYGEGGPGEILEGVDEQVYTAAPEAAAPAETARPTPIAEFVVPPYKLEAAEVESTEGMTDLEAARTNADKAVTYASRIYDMDLTGATVLVSTFPYDPDIDSPASMLDYYIILPLGVGNDASSTFTIDVALNQKTGLLNDIYIPFEDAFIQKNAEATRGIVLTEREYAKFEKKCLLDFRRANMYFMDDNAAYDRIINKSLLAAWPAVPSTPYGLPSPSGVPGTEFIILLKGGDGYRAVYTMTPDEEPLLAAISYLTPEAMASEMQVINDMETERYQ
ncbi:MAG TPA: hypothetical protein DEB31_03750 [Clostridiales bacterium]|nr:hypothetical protein [Clostridiales bacterium]